MNYRISPLWWPAMALTSPALALMLTARNRRFLQNIEASRKANRQLMSVDAPLILPELEYLNMDILVEEACRNGFGHAPGVSYYLTTDRGRVLFDLGFGDEDRVLSTGIRSMGLDLSGSDGVIISHLHPDHMGGFKAARKKVVPLPKGCEALAGLPCFVPEAAGSREFKMETVTGPRLLPAGFGSTGPLARSLFFAGFLREQALLARIKGKGIVVITGCGHPTIETILAMTRQLTDEPVYAVVGGLHLPVTDSPWKEKGFKVQMILGTGKPPWQKINDRDVDRAVDAINRAGVGKIFLSTHDICPYAIDRLDRETSGDLVCLEAGGSYRIGGTSGS